MLYHGIDLIEVQRINKAVARWGERFLQRVFLSTELADSGGRGTSLAARWAAKEAAAKALGVGLQGLGGGTTGDGGVLWHEIEVVRSPSGKPELRLHGSAARRSAGLGWEEVALSLSHTGDLALASVVAIGRSAD